MTDEMKMFRVKETYKVTQWTYVRARSLEEAQKILESGDEDFEHSQSEINQKHMDTDWDSLQEVKPKARIMR